MGNLFRISGSTYSENNPRVEGTHYAAADNIKWVGGFGSSAELFLKKSDRKIKILFYCNRGITFKVRTYKENEETLAESFSLNKDTSIEKIYDLSENTKIKFGMDDIATSDDYILRMEYKIW